MKWILMLIVACFSTLAYATPTNDELDARLKVLERIAGVDQPATQPATVPVVIPPDVPPVIPTPTSTSRTPLPPIITTSNKIYDGVDISVKAGQVWDGQGATYKGRIYVNRGGKATNFRYYSRPGTGDVLTVDNATASNFETLLAPAGQTAYNGLYVKGTSTIQRAIVRTVHEYPLFIENSGGFLVEDVAILGGSTGQSVTRWGNSWGTFHRLYIRATVGRALSRGDSILPGVIYDSCDIEGSMAHAPQNPLGENNGGQGRGRIEFDFTTGTWTADDTAAMAEQCRKAGADLIARGVTDYRQIMRASAAVASRGGVKCAALSDADCDRTWLNRQAMIKKTGFASHKNTRVAALCLSPEAGGISSYEGDCELKLKTLFGTQKTTYPFADWRMPGDASRIYPNFVIKCIVTTTGGLGTDQVTASKLLKGSTGKIDGGALP